MSVSRSTACLFCTFREPLKRQIPKARRQFHISTPVQAKKPNNASRNAKPATSSIKPSEQYQQSEPSSEKSKYTAAQLKAIELTQKHLNYEPLRETLDLPRTMQDVERGEDLTYIDPVLDKPVRQPWSSLDENSRLKTEDELNEDMARFMQNMPQDEKAAAAAFQQFFDNNRITVGKESAEFAPRSALNTDNSQVYKDQTDTQKKSAAQQQKESDGAVQGTEEVSPALVRVMQMTGMDRKTLRGLRVKSVISHRVVNQTRLGKIQKMYWLSIAGNENGLLGIGEGKSEESAEGMIQSQYRAIRNMVPIMRYENRTIFGEVHGKSGATELHLTSRPPGKIH